MNTLYMVGGALRAGKTIIAAKMLNEHGIPYFGLDYLTGSLQIEARLGISHEQDVRERAEKLWPFVRALSENLLYAEPRYLIDGEALLPKDLHEYHAKGKNIRMCFLGYADASPEEKLKSVRNNPSPVNDWSKDRPDEDLLEELVKGVSFSRYLRDECEKYGVHYFDTSQNFQGAITKAAQALLEGN